jgi:tetratricopeptide (TPR) repeat protein
MAAAAVVAILLNGHRGTNEAFNELVHQGEGFIHGAPTPYTSYRMPLSGIAMGLYYFHAAKILQPVLLFLTRISVPLLVFELGTLLGAGAGPAALGVALAAALVPMRAAIFTEELFYQAALLLSAAVLAWRAQAPSLKRSAVLGLTVGLSMLIRSPLALFTPCLVLFELFERRAATAKGRIADALVLILTPWLAVTPWAYVNWRMLGRFVPLEFHRADSNLVAGVLGKIYTVNFDAPRLAEYPTDTGLLRWAAGQVLRRPGLYAWSFLGRLGYALSLHPLLCGFAVLAVCVCRRNRAQRHIAVLTVYYLTAHCFLAVGTRYFDPLWPIVAAMVAAGIAASAQPKERAPRHGPWIARTALSALTATGILALGFVAAYPARLSGGPGRLDSAVAGNPGDPWPRYFRARSAIEDGRAARAEPDLAAAAALRPDYFTFDFAHVLALAALGRASEADLERLGGNYSDVVDPRFQKRQILLLRVLRLLSQERAPQPHFADLVRCGVDAPEDLDTPWLAEYAKAWAPRGRLILISKLQRIGIHMQTMDLVNLMTGAARVAGSHRDARTEAEALSIIDKISERLPAAQSERSARAAAPGRPGDALALYTDQELGPLAGSRDSLTRSFSAFAAHDWGEGFHQLGPVADRLSDLDAFCAQRTRTCGPWRDARGEIRRLNDAGMKYFLAGDRRGAARNFDSVLAWLPTEPSALVNRAVTADADGDDTLALKLYDAAAGLPQTSTLYQAEVLTARATLLEKLGRKSEAIADLRRADKTAPPDWARRADTRRELQRLGGPGGRG